ncbi:hypothetical protein DY000_02042942 [Brassica cretica]|uniref:Uncharacterized protein n=1 Tax=Brassica cretica TaxID=69181 RepID=A0ABQ7BF80_BRACR|nr:hypothetical protein DY000_02042942 [Brassica cretica]
MLKSQNKANENRESNSFMQLLDSSEFSCLKEETQSMIVRLISERIEAGGGSKEGLT